MGVKSGNSWVWMLPMLVALGGTQPGCGDGGVSESDGDAGSGSLDEGGGGQAGQGGEPAPGDGDLASLPPLTRDRVRACDDGPIATVEIEAPTPAGCLTDVSAGDHKFVCDDVSFLLKVPERCTEYSCGLIVDVHGGTMSAEQMRQVTLLDELAPPCDYIVLHPSETSPLLAGVMTTSQWNAGDDPKIRDFIDTTLEAFDIDRDRVHFTGFSLGGNMSWRFICEHGELFTSVAPIAATDTCGEGGLPHEFPILYMHGYTDLVVDYDGGEAMIGAVAAGLGMGGSEIIEEGEHYVRHRYESDDGLMVDFIEHGFGGQPALDGHCVPGGVDLEGPFATTCQTPAGAEQLFWGETVLDFFLEAEGR